MQADNDGAGISDHYASRSGSSEPKRKRLALELNQRMPVSTRTQLPSLMAGRWPEDVGILAMETYFPYTCVNQTELEAFDGASAGKYTIGLGQRNMGFCGDREDVHSLALTVVQALVEKNGVSYKDIGRMEVGTETILDKSKSVKTVLMQLFVESGNSSVEGIDTTNACFGGTQAVFNAVSWVESSAWDGRFALVVAADIAVYATGNARPTGGAGAVAMLIGPNAPIVIERGLRGTHMEHAYDFYKPDLSSEYPVVDGKLSIQCYIQALDICYRQYADRASSVLDKPFSFADADFIAFHCPFAKLVQKSLARLKLNDFLCDPSPDTTEGGVYAGLDELRGRSLEDTLTDKAVEKTMMKSSAAEFTAKTDPTLLLGREVGNMYTASLYGGLASLLACKSAEELAGKRCILFSYGSGLASAMYSLRFSPDAARQPALAAVVRGLSDIPARLKSRRVLVPADFEKIMKLREETHHSAPYSPLRDISELFPGTYYLTGVDAMHRRVYARIPPEEKCLANLHSPLRTAAADLGATGSVSNGASSSS